jgi:hypothetical protein
MSMLQSRSIEPGATGGPSPTPRSLEVLNDSTRIDTPELLTPHWSERSPIRRSRTGPRSSSGTAPRGSRSTGSSTLTADVSKFIANRALPATRSWK